MDASLLGRRTRAHLTHMARLAPRNNPINYVLYINTQQRGGPTGSTGTKYFPVHIDYNTMIKIELFEPWPCASKNIKATVCFFLTTLKMSWHQWRLKWVMIQLNEGCRFSGIWLEEELEGLEKWSIWCYSWKPKSKNNIVSVKLKLELRSITNAKALEGGSYFLWHVQLQFCT